MSYHPSQSLACSPCIIIGMVIVQFLLQFLRKKWCFRYRKVYNWTDAEHNSLRDALVMLKRDGEIPALIQRCMIQADVDLVKFWNDVGNIQRAGKLCYGQVLSLAMLMLVIHTPLQR